MGLPFKLKHTVLDWRKINEKYIVIFDYMEFPKNSPALNLSAFDGNGKLLWTTKPKSSFSTDAWVNFISISPLVVGNFDGFNAEIDINTGNIIRTKFTK